jgi:hypothetical protein
VDSHTVQAQINCLAHKEVFHTAAFNKAMCRQHSPSEIVAMEVGEQTRAWPQDPTSHARPASPAHQERVP